MKSLKRTKYQSCKINKQFDIIAAIIFHTCFSVPSLIKKSLFFFSYFPYFFPMPIHGISRNAGIRVEQSLYTTHMRHCSCRCRRTSAVIYRLYNQFAYMNRRPFGVNYEFVSAGYTRGRVRWPWIAIKCKSPSSGDPLGRLQEANRRRFTLHLFPRFRETDRNFRPMLFNISRSMVGNIGGKLDSGFIERRVANNSIRGERLKNY